VAVIAINDNPSVRELRQFAAIIFPLFWLIVACLLYFGAQNPRAAVIAASGGAIVGAIGAARPAFIRPIYLIWMYAAYPIGFAVSHLILAAIFYGVVTPIGLVMKGIGYDPLQRRIRTGTASYWSPVEPVTDDSQYFRQS